MAQGQRVSRSETSCVYLWCSLTSKQSSAENLWTALDEQNQALSTVLRLLSTLHAKNSEAYAIAVKYLSTLQWRQASGSSPQFPDRLTENIALVHVQWLAHPQTPKNQRPVFETFFQAHSVAEVRALLLTTLLR